MEDYIIQKMMSGLIFKMYNEGFYISINTVKYMNIHIMYGSFVLYFTVDRNGRSDEEIDLLARQHKIELIFITGLPSVNIRYSIKENIEKEGDVKV